VVTLGARETGQAAPLPRDAARADRRRLAHLALLAAPQMVALPCSHAERLGYGSVRVTDTTFLSRERHIVPQGRLSDTA